MQFECKQGCTWDAIPESAVGGGEEARGREGSQHVAHYVEVPVGRPELRLHRTDLRISRAKGKGSGPLPPSVTG